MLAETNGNQRELTMTKRKWTREKEEEQFQEWIRDGWLAERYEVDPETGRSKRVLVMGELWRQWLADRALRKKSS
jgi:hypothetical protein